MSEPSRPLRALAEVAPGVVPGVVAATSTIWRPMDVVHPHHPFDDSIQSGWRERNAACGRHQRPANALTLVPWYPRSDIHTLLMESECHREYSAPVFSPASR